MPELLIFRLYAPMAAFGDVAVGERRPTSRHPSHSALVGLLCAALGIRRDDPTLPALAAGYAFAIRVESEGELLADYHTAQTPPQRKGESWRTRREELAGKVNTILSRRDYRIEPAFTIAVLASDGAPESLSSLEQALRMPRFMLYAGRKSCPLGLPPDPARFEAGSLAEAFALYDSARTKYPCREIWANSGAKDVHFAPIFVDVDLAPDKISRRGERRDTAPDRRLWRFERREEWTARMAPPATDKEDRA